MNKRQENRLSMFYVVKSTLEENAAIWSGTPAIVTAKAEYDGNVKSLEDALELQLRDIRGHAVDKRNAEAMNIVPSELRRYRDSVVAQRCQDVHDLANGVLASLADYGVDAAKLTAFQARINAYLTENTAPRLAITARKNATAVIEELVEETLTMLNRRMDPLMQGFANTHPEFHRQYTDARIIVDLGGTGDGEDVPPAPPVPPTP